MLIFQMLLDINKPPNQRAEIRFERSTAWRYRDVYLSWPISVAGWLSDHLVFTYDKGFPFDYQLSCSQQRGHSGEHSLYKNPIVALRESRLELHTPDLCQTGWDCNSVICFYCTMTQAWSRV